MTPTPTQALEPVEVSQAARDAAAALVLADGNQKHRAARILTGSHDEAPTVQAFARFERDTIERHRQSSNAAPVGVEARRLAVRTIIDVYNSARPASMSPVEFVLSKRVVQEALASLSTPTAEPIDADDEQPGDYLRDNLLNIAAICEAKGLFVEASSLRNTAAIVSDQLRRALPAEALSDLQRLGQEYDGDALREAATALLEGLSSTYTARNGREVGIQGDDGEKCYIVHSDFVFDLRRALSATPPAQEGEGDD